MHFSYLATVARLATGGTDELTLDLLLLAVLMRHFTALDVRCFDHFFERTISVVTAKLIERALG